MLETFTRLRENLEKKKPLVHVYGNPVTSNDCANALLAVGASPIMAESPYEAKEITLNADVLVLNLGVPSPEKLRAMLISAEIAQKKGIPIVFDPVGAGSSEFRKDASREILKTAPCLIRGNLSEILSLSDVRVQQYGVDNGISETVTEILEVAKNLAKLTYSVIAVSGRNDIISDGMKNYVIQNGVTAMKKVTGAGCMLSAIMGAFLSVSTPLEASVLATSVFGYCGEKASVYCRGSGSLRTGIIDELSNLESIDSEDAFKITAI